MRAIGEESRQGRYSLIQGDITEIEADAIVNAANNQLWMGGGVAGAIKRKGGKEIEDEAVGEGPIPIGEASVSGAGRLKARYVIHAAVMGMDFRTDAGKIRQATANTLKRAEELKMKTIAFPALGTGVGGFPYEECARIMLGEVKKHLAGKTDLEKVLLVLWGKEAYGAFETELSKL